MGFTSYWRTSEKGIPPPAWFLICQDTIKLLAALPAHSASAMGYHSTDPLEIAFEADLPNNPPKVSEDLIRFNGKGELGHETFYFERAPKPRPWQHQDGMVFAFCKTARKPYDLVVCAVLIVIARHAGESVSVTSDGTPAEWQPALNWVTAVLGAGYSIPAGVLGEGGGA